ncbi:E3 ubiquitin-protein ligase RNF170-like isoform X1 [Telopea speciosissima]|uniref:E3 ubiquitin-protein ligase RNF170-like isoform X1 n=1 Tax=Telopea speciosissima TaxID=54955 RepID=UPI001CC82650|nr:E3 ubiquitin-protein ligase RNF170-like isoform X1 [Telopea speciosissima]
MDGPPENDCCSICHDNFNIPCQANCSHWFCGNCILRVWQHGAALSPCKCPICRHSITLLITREASLQHPHDPEVSEVLKSIRRYNHSFGGGTNSLIQAINGSFPVRLYYMPCGRPARTHTVCGQRLQDLPFLLWRLSRALADPQRSLPLFSRLRMVLPMLMTFIYMLSPINIIPKGIAGFIGILDEVVIALILFLHVAAMYRSARLSRHGGS